MCFKCKEKFKNIISNLYIIIMYVYYTHRFNYYNVTYLYGNCLLCIKACKRIIMYTKYLA